MNPSASETDAPVARARAMDRYASGDDSALAELYDDIGPKIHRFFVRRTRSGALSDDLLQQTFLNMHCARATFRPGADPLPWAFAIGHRLLIDHTRRARRLGKLAAPRDTEEGRGDDGVVDFVNPEQIASTAQLARLLDRELARLPEAYRVAFELVRFEGLSMSEAAEMLGTTPNAVKLRAHRAYDALRAALSATELARL